MKTIKPTISRWRRFRDWSVRVDSEILAECPSIDHYMVSSKALLFAAVGCIALFAWGAFFFQFCPFYIAVPLTLVVVTIILMIDQFVGSSRWHLTGILRTPGHTWRDLVSAGLIFRVAIALILALGTSDAASKAISAATIQMQEQKDRDAGNAAKEKAAAVEKTQTRQVMLGAFDAEVKQSTDDLGAINAQLAAARQSREDAARQLTDNQIKSDCEIHGGPGCRAGFGPAAREAARRQREAADTQRRVEGDIGSLEARRAAAERRHDDAVAALQAHEPEFLAAAKLIDERVAASLFKPTNDPLMSEMALQRVFADPDIGPTARRYSWLLMLLLLTMEISYVMVSEYFAHASIYMLRLIARTKGDAAIEAHKLRQTMINLLPPAGEHEQVQFRIVPRFGSDD